MKNKNCPILIMFCFLQCSLFAQKAYVLFEVNETEIIQYNAAMSDEFNANRVNENLWYDYYPWGGVSIDAKTYTSSEMCKVKNGSLLLALDTTSKWFEFPDWMLDTAYIRKAQVKKLDGKIQMNYLSSAVWSKEKFKYGYFECMCKMPEGQGYWPAFWMYGGEPNEEIDFMEGKGEREKQIHVDIHCPNRCDRVKKFGFIDKPFGHWVKTKNNLLNNWVHFSGKWTPEGVSFYINGNWVASHLLEFNTSMNLIANLSLAKDKGPFSPGPNSKTNFPAVFEVDYMRVWQWKETQTKNMEALQKQASTFITWVPMENKQYLLEYKGDLKNDLSLEIQKDGSRYIVLDIRSENQWIDTSYWPKGKYELVCKKNGKEKKETIINL